MMRQFFFALKFDSSENRLVPTHWMRNGGRIVSGTATADYKNCGNLKWHEFKVFNLQIPAICLAGRMAVPLMACVLVATGRLEGDTIIAKSASRADVGAAVAAATDGDTVTIPAGTVTWTSTLTVTKNIQIIGAGEGSTVITENLPRANNASLFDISLSHESSAPAYSFRLSGMTLKSANPVALATDNAFIELRGTSHGTDSPVPYVRGCVSRCRIDHMTWDNLNGLSLLVDSCLGVADHITSIANDAGSPSIKVFMQNWTPEVNPADGVALPKSYLAVKGFGSWADDSYWGTDKFWFFEDSNFHLAD